MRAMVHRTHSTSICGGKWNLIVKEKSELDFQHKIEAKENSTYNNKK